MDSPETPWYHDGLAFECTRCGACCTGVPGYVWVDAEQIQRLADHLRLSVEDFGRQYLRQVGQRLSLIERPNGDCVFWSRSSGCTVYQARPNQCQTWPFWPDNLESPEEWARATRTCPGTGQGQWFSLEEIRASAARTPQ
ncbi:MAG: YkgJ family cysteine cluster protein [Isosphaeraceae bacterium]